MENSSRVPDFIPAQESTAGFTSAADHSVLSEDAAESEAGTNAQIPSLADSEAAEKPKQDRVRVSGRLVYAPRVHTFPNGNLRVTLTIAEHLDTGETVYHNAYATKRFAEGIARRELKKGDLVELAGQRQLVTRKDREGNDRQVPVIYAYGVKPR